MIRNSRRVVALAIAGALVIAPAVSGCAAGTKAETNVLPTQLTEGLNAATDSGILIRNLFVLGPAAGQKLEAGSAAAVYGSLVNQSKDGKADKLVAVTSPAFRQGARLAGGGLALPMNQGVSLSSAAPAEAAAPEAPVTAPETPAKVKKPDTASATPDAAEPSAPEGKATPAGTTAASPAASAEASAAAGSPAVVLAGLTKPLFGGETVDVVLQFERGGSITLKVPVVPHAGDFATYAPAPGTTSAPVSTAVPATEATPATGGEHGAHTGPATEATPAAEATPGH